MGYSAYNTEHDFNNKFSPIGWNNIWRLSVLILIFLLSAILRLRNITAPGEQVEREYTSAVFARAFYFENNPSIEKWRQELARTVMENQPVLEPPLTDYLVSLIYRLMEREVLWYARFLTSCFWLVGGIFLYLLVKDLLNADGALVATAYYLLVPSGILLSRSFQPDALMMMLFLISLYFILRYFNKPSLQRLLIAALLTGITLLLRPLVLFALMCVFLSLSIYQKRTWKVVFDRQFVIFILVSLFLPIAYYGYGIFIAGYMRWKITTSFLPDLYLYKEFWKNWFYLVANEINYPALLVALPGFWLLPKGRIRAFAFGLVLGYVIFGLLFTMHIHTHPYYHIQLLPLIGICIAPIIIQGINALRNTGSKFWWLPVLGVAMVILIYGYLQVKDFTDSLVFENPDTSREIGEIVKHSQRTVFLAYHYGLPLEYYGELSGSYWPRSIDYYLVRPKGVKELSVQERLNNLGYKPDYFIITHFKEYSTHHQDLQTYLVNNCSLLAQTEQYLIYNACKADGL